MDKFKIFDIIVLLSAAKILFDGFSSEFAQPTPFDLIKWGCYLLLLICYFIYRRFNSGRKKRSK